MPSQKVASAYVDLELRTAAFKAAIGEATSTMRQAQAQMREEMEKSRESVRLLSEGLGLGIPRGLQNIISKAPGVATALNLAFDAVVVFALIKTVIEVGDRVVEFAKKSEEAARKSAEANQMITDSLRKTNLELAVSNDKIADSIAKLSHKPENALRDALDEARSSAFELSKQLDDTINKERELLDSTGANFIHKLLGDKGNEPLKPGLNEYQSQQQGVYERFNQETTPGSWTATDVLLGRKQTPDEAAKARDEELTRNSEAYYNSLNTQLSERQRLQAIRTSGGGMTDERFALEQKYGTSPQSNEDLMSLQNLMEHIGSIGHNQQEQSSADTLKPQERYLEGKKDADSLLLKSFEDASKKQKAEYGMTLAQDIQFWSARISYFSSASDEYRTIQDKLYADYEQRSARLRELQKSTIVSGTPDDVNRASDALNKLLVEQAEDVTQTGQRWTAFNSQLEKGYEGYDKFSEKLSETKTKIAEATGALSPHAAALLESAAHAAAYAASMADLDTQIKKVKNDTSLTDVERKTQLAALGNQQSDTRYSNQIQNINDAQAVWSTSFSGAMDDSFNSLIRRSTDFNAQFKELLTSTVGEVNDAIVKLLTTKNDPHPFRAAGHAIFTDVAKTGLEHAEGGLLQVLGLGGGKKPSGSANDPIYTRNADMVEKSGAAGIASTAGSGLLGFLNNSDSAGKLFGGRLFGSGGIFDRQANSISTNRPNPSSIPGIINSIGQAGVKFAGAASSNTGSDDAPVPGGAYSGESPILYQNGEPYGTMSYANGGIISPGDWHMVGEEGPELLQVGSTSKINNARDTASIMTGNGGSTTNHSWNIDARGANDPAAVNAAVQRGIASAAPHLVAASAAQHKDTQRRTPTRR